MTRDRPGPEVPGEPDFDRRWQDLAQQISQELPPDLQHWVSAGPSGGPLGGDRGHVVWGTDPDGWPPAEDSLDDAAPQVGGSGRSGPEQPEPDWSAEPGSDIPPGQFIPPSAASGPRDWIPPEEDDHFEPPEAPPVLAGNPVVIASWVGLLGGIALVFGWVMFGGRMPVVWAHLGLVFIVGGAAALISRLPRGRPPDGEPSGSQSSGD
ncbi:MAG: hypothetical protein LBJ62_00685 [Bifidobacteriaceae bacterium]|nr:hypothetical protein [Bifidobacteriaceae bacterium]